MVPLLPLSYVVFPRIRYVIFFFFFSPILFSFCLGGYAAFLRFQLWVVLSVAAVCLCQEAAVQHEYVFVCSGSLVIETTFFLLVPVVWHWAGQILLLFCLPVARPPIHNASCFCCLSSMVTPVSQHADRCATTEQRASDLRRTLGHLGKLLGACGRLAFDVDSLIIYWSLCLWRSILFNLIFFSLFSSVFLSAVYTRGCQSGDRTPDGGSEKKHCRGELSFPPAASCG